MAKKSWKGERASVKRGGKADSNKYSKSDSGKKPAPGTRKTFWRGGSTRSDGTKVKGHYVKNPNYKGR